MVATCSAVNLIRIVTVNLDCPDLQVFSFGGNKLAKLRSLSFPSLLGLDCKWALLWVILVFNLKFYRILVIWIAKPPYITFKNPLYDFFYMKSAAYTQSFQVEETIPIHNQYYLIDHIKIADYKVDEVINDCLFVSNKRNRKKSNNKNSVLILTLYLEVCDFGTVSPLRYIWGLI